MTVKQLKAFLKDLPNDVEVYFDLWQSDDRYHHFILNESNKVIETEKESGRKCISIGHADNCMAHRMRLKSDYYPVS